MALRTSVKVGHQGYAAAIQIEYKRAVAKVVAVAFTRAFAQVKKIGFSGVATASQSTAVSNSYVQDQSQTFSKDVSVQTGNKLP